MTDKGLPVKNSKIFSLIRLKAYCKMPPTRVDFSSPHLYPQLHSVPQHTTSPSCPPSTTIASIAPLPSSYPTIRYSSHQRRSTIVKICPLRRRSSKNAFDAVWSNAAQWVRVDQRRRWRWPHPALPTARFARKSFKTTSHISSQKNTPRDRIAQLPHHSSKNSAMPSKIHPHTRKTNTFARNADRSSSNEWEKREEERGKKVRGRRVMRRDKISALD